MTYSTPSHYPPDERYSIILGLRYGMGMRLKVIAYKMGVTDTTIVYHIKKAREYYECIG